MAAGHVRPPGLVIYDCRMDNTGTRGWVPPRIVFFYLQPAQRVRILDGRIRHFYGHAIEGRVSHSSDGRLRFDWIERLPDNHNRHVVVKYAAVNGAGAPVVNVGAVVEGFSNHENAFGHCRQR